MSCERGIHGVGMLVADRWIEKMLAVKRVSERLMVVRVIVGRSVPFICLYSADGKVKGGKRGVF